MRTKVTTIVAASLIAASPAVFAITQANASEAAPAEKMNEMTQDDSETGHGMAMKNSDMPMKQMMTQMNEMMETCNKMMQGKMKDMNSPDGSTDKG